MNATVHPISSPIDTSIIERRMRAFVEAFYEKPPHPDVFVLYHEDRPDGSSVHTRRVQSTKNKGSQVDLAEAMAKEVLSVAKDHFESFGGSGQRYRLSAELDNKEILQSYFFCLGSLATRSVRGDEDKSEKKHAKEKDFTREMMRQVTDSHKIIVELVNNIAQPLSVAIAQNAELAAEISKLSKRRIEDYEAKEQLLDRQAERDLLRRKEENAERRRSDAFDKFMGRIAPAIEFQLMKKIGAAQKTAQGVAQGATQEETAKKSEKDQVAEGQALLREIFKFVGREMIASSLPQDKRILVDDLVGLGTDPKNVDELRLKLKELWNEIPEEVDNAMQAKLVAERADLLERLLALFDGKKQEEQKQ